MTIYEEYIYILNFNILLKLWNLKLFKLYIKFWCLQGRIA